MKMEKKKKLLDKLFAMQRFGIKPGLERTEALLDKLDNPHRKLKTIHVAGTNGKGSVCSMLASVFTSMGYKTGLYTSPHLFDFNERIRINGEKISDDSLVDLAEKVIKKAEKIEATFFEITTAIAFDYFASQNVDIAIIETGMGGQFDSTNVLKPILSIITRVDVDHTEYLGDTIELIAAEKAGIIKPGTPVILSENIEAVQQIIKQKANSVGSEFIYSPDRFTEFNYTIDNELQLNIDAVSTNYQYKNLTVGIAGTRQHENIKTVITALEIIGDAMGIMPFNIFVGLKNVVRNTGLCGRIQMVQSDPPIIFDVAHNPNSFAALKSTLLEAMPYTRFTVVFAAMSDKDYASVLVELKEFCDAVILTRPNLERAATTAKLEEAARNAGFTSIETAATPNEAFVLGKEKNCPLLVAGSFYLLGEIEEFAKMTEKK